MRLSLFTTLLLASSFLGFSVGAEAPDPDPGRFEDAIETFINWDNKNSFPEDAILFVGSSSMRLWSTALAFPDKPVINRGFGGSELSDVIYYFDQVIKPYSPRKILLYAGDNDVGNGKSAVQVFEDYKELVALLRANLPGSELIFISIKPSKFRWDKWPIMVDANRMVRNYAAKHPDLDYADLAAPLLDDDGMPKDVFADDGLHLNEQGYLLWQEALAPFLD
jgi:lysophospholipase L1-like esterase